MNGYDRDQPMRPADEQPERHAEGGAQHIPPAAGRWAIFAEVEKLDPEIAARLRQGVAGVFRFAAQHVRQSFGKTPLELADDAAEPTGDLDSEASRLCKTLNAATSRIRQLEDAVWALGHMREANISGQAAA